MSALQRKYVRPAKIKETTFEDVENAIHTQYQKQKTLKGKSLASKEFKKLVNDVFKNLGLDPAGNAQHSKWHQTILITSGSKGGLKTAAKPKKKK